MNYRELNKWLRTADHAKVWLALQDERDNQNRKTFMKRLHQRYCALRAARERKELGL